MEKECVLCPRECGARRELGERGVCGEGAQMRISRISLHPYEEPPLSTKNGSGTVFFCGCSLGCVFCQNRDISHGKAEGKIYAPEELCEEVLSLQEKGAANINLVTPTHFADKVAQTLTLAKPHLHIPVVYNSSGYEKLSTLAMLDGLVDVYMPDLKYASDKLSADYSHAPDYSKFALPAIKEMLRQVGEPRFDSDGTMLNGVIVRHLVLPACRADSIEALRALADTVPPDKILLSLMSQYTPDFAQNCEFKNLHRKLTSFEYNSVVDEALLLGFDGFMQSRASAVSDYTPKFK